MTMSKAGLVVGPPPILFTAAPADTYRNLIEDPTPAVEGNIMNYTAKLVWKKVRHNRIILRKQNGRSK
jgi:hypothetical protein